MKINKSEFKISVASPSKILKTSYSEVAFVGRSNVGKSSLLNMLTNKKKLAKASNTPGRTRLINYFLINDAFYFVDLPGYGFAKASKTESQAWQSLIEPYLIENSALKCVCVLLDIRHDASEQDKQMINFLNYYRIPFIIIATKSDKFAKSKVKPMAEKLANSIGVGKDNIIPVSNETAFGKEQVLSKLDQFLE